MRDMPQNVMYVNAIQHAVTLFTHTHTRTHTHTHMYIYAIVFKALLLPQMMAEKALLQYLILYIWKTLEVLSMSLFIRQLWLCRSLS